MLCFTHLQAQPDLYGVLGTRYPSNLWNGLGLGIHKLKLPRCHTATSDPPAPDQNIARSGHAHAYKVPGSQLAQPSPTPMPCGATRLQIAVPWLVSSSCEW